jgi:predicted nucleic acid-binding protein
VASFYERLPARHEYPLGDHSHSPDPRVNAWVLAQDEAALHLSVVTIGELRKGLTILPESKRRSQLQDWLENDLIPLFRGRVLPVTQLIADRWGVLSGMRQMAGRPLSMADGLIAATGLEHGLVVVTRNVRDYEGLGVTLLNPWEAAPATEPARW